MPNNWIAKDANGDDVTVAARDIGSDVKRQEVETFEGGAYSYDAGTAPATVDIPATARLRSVQVAAGAAAATVTIGGGDTITIPAGAGWQRDIPGRATGADVVIGGSVVSYYVDWTTA